MLNIWNHKVFISATKLKQAILFVNSDINFQSLLSYEADSDSDSDSDSDADGEANFASLMSSIDFCSLTHSAQLVLSTGP